MSESAVPNLKRLRVERNMTQPELGAALGVSARTVLRWEQGEGEPVASELMRMAQFLGVGIDQLISDLVKPAPALKVASLAEKDLNYWVARARGLDAHMTEDGAVFYAPGFGQRPVPSYTDDWASAGPIIDEAGIQWQPIAAGAIFDGVKVSADGWLARCIKEPHLEMGRTQRIAAMRAYVASEYGAYIIT